MMRRRTFLAGATAAFGATQSIIDTHVHFYDPTRPQGVPWPPKTESLLYKPVFPKSYQSLVEPLGVKGAVVVEQVPGARTINGADLAKENPVIVALVGHLDPGTPPFGPTCGASAKTRSSVVFVSAEARYSWTICERSPMPACRSILSAMRPSFRRCSRSPTKYRTCG